MARKKEDSFSLIRTTKRSFRKLMKQILLSHCKNKKRKNKCHQLKKAKVETRSGKEVLSFLLPHQDRQVW